MSGTNTRGYHAVALHRAKTPSNIAAVLRAAGCYGSAIVVVDGARYRKSPIDTPKQWRHMPLIEVANVMDSIPYNCVPVAIDLVDGAVPLHEYQHPERAFYVFGPEDGTLGQKITGRCRDVVYVDTPGPCMNLAAAVNVVLYDREAKRLRAGGK